MPRKLPQEKIDLMRSLFEEGLSQREIARQVGVSYGTAYGYTRARQRGFKSLREYHEHLAIQNGFKSYEKYHKHLARESGFDSRSEYEEDLAAKRSKRPENMEFAELVKEG